MFSGERKARRSEVWEAQGENARAFDSTEEGAERGWNSLEGIEVRQGGEEG